MDELESKELPGMPKAGNPQLNGGFIKLQQFYVSSALVFHLRAGFSTSKHSAHS